jgi:hypothetical protein
MDRDEIGRLAGECFQTVEDRLLPAEAAINGDR